MTGATGFCNLIAKVKSYHVYCFPVISSESPNSAQTQRVDILPNVSKRRWCSFGPPAGRLTKGIAALYLALSHM